MKKIFLVVAIAILFVFIGCSDQKADATVTLIWMDGSKTQISILKGDYTLPSAKGSCEEYNENDYVWSFAGKGYKSGETINVLDDITIVQKCTVGVKEPNTTPVTKEEVEKKFLPGEKVENTFKEVDKEGKEKEVKYTKDSKIINIENASDFVAVMTKINDFGNANYEINLKNSIDLEGIEWTPVVLNGYNADNLNGCKVVLNGNGYSIYNMKIESTDKAGLFAGTYSTVMLEINDLMIDGADINADKKVKDLAFAAGFVACTDSSNSVKLNNCILKDSTIESLKYAGGMMAWNSGYSDLNNGPVKTYVDFNGCKVIGSTLTAGGSVGGIIGHAGASSYTYNTVDSCIVENTSIKSTGTSDNKAGAIVGTANVGEMVIKNSTYNNGVTVESNKTVITDRCYGRTALNGIGKLEIDGEKITD